MGKHMGVKLRYFYWGINVRHSKDLRCSRRKENTPTEIGYFCGMYTSVILNTQMSAFQLREKHYSTIPSFHFFDQKKSELCPPSFPTLPEGKVVRLNKPPPSRFGFPFLESRCGQRRWSRHRRFPGFFFVTISAFGGRGGGTGFG